MSLEPSPDFSPAPRRSFWGGVLRVFLLLLVGILVGVGIFWGLSALYREAVLPARSSASELDALQQRLAQEQTQLQDRLRSLDERLTLLESQRVADADTIAELQSAVNALQKDVDGHTLTLARLDELDAALGRLQKSAGETSAQVGAIQKAMSDENAPLAQVQRQVQVLRAMELLSRARLLLIQNNAGLAREDVLAARAVLEALGKNAPIAQKVDLDAWTARLDLALSNLPALPVLASNDLEIAWRMMAGEMPAELVPLATLPAWTETPTPYIPAAGETLTPYDTPPFPTYTPYVTSTPFPTNTPYETPTAALP